MARSAACQFGMAGLVAVIQKLDGQPVAGPVHLRGGLRHPQGQRTFVADGKLDQHMRQFGFGHAGAPRFRAAAEQAHPGQTRKLNRKGANADQNDAKGKLKEKGKTVHGDRSGPQKCVFS